MTGHALDVLEFERVLERIGQRASSDAGRLRVRALRPRSDPAGIGRELMRVAAVGRFFDESSNWALGAIPDVGEEIIQLSVDGSVLDPTGLFRVGVLLTSSRTLAAELKRHGASYPELDSIQVRLLDDQELERSIERCVDGDGNVLDTASPDLKKIRHSLKGAHAKIVRQLEKFLGTLADRFVVPDASITIREGRYVIPVRREGRGDVGGIVHDESQTGSTLFIEPPAAIEAMNALRDLEREEGREIRRVLGQMTERIAPDGPLIAGAFDALADFDSLYARARAAKSWGGVVPEVSDDRRLELRGARHPLLIEADEGPVVPYDLTLEVDERCLVVSGPNTGGKSVFLKATGLIATLAQAGVIPPVEKGTHLPVFRSFFADIGDEQSIARSLSTFSAHLSNLSAIVSGADDHSLVLIDEMGTGTDPAEGAALARAVMEALVARGATTIVSSHLGELKQLDQEGSGIVNASLQFDSERMEPTYRLMKGLPGRSYGLAIARSLGFPGDVLDRAESYRDQGTARMEDVLTRLEGREQEVERLADELDAARASTDRLRTDVETREHSLKEAEKTADVRAHDDARKLLLAAREEVEEAIFQLRLAAEEGRSLADAAREARRRVEMAAGRHLDDSSVIHVEHGEGNVEEGDRVRIHATGAKGRVVDVRTNRALVEVGALRFEVALAELEPLDAASQPQPSAKSSAWRGTSDGEARFEVDLRGMRVDEMELALTRALDGAILEDLKELRIIHGKGTGALRKRVAELLRSDRRVADFRMGGPTEGGAGVTVASFGVPA